MTLPTNIDSGTPQPTLSQDRARRARKTVNMNTRPSTVYVCDTDLNLWALSRLFRSVAHTQALSLLYQLNRSPFLLRYGSAASYLLRFLSLSSALIGAWPTGAASSLASLLGFDAWSSALPFGVSVGVPPATFALPLVLIGFALVFLGCGISGSKRSNRRNRACFSISASYLAARSALILRFEK